MGNIFSGIMKGLGSGLSNYGQYKADEMKQKRLMDLLLQKSEIAQKLQERKAAQEREGDLMKETVGRIAQSKLDMGQYPSFGGDLVDSNFTGPVNPKSSQTNTVDNVLKTWMFGGGQAPSMGGLPITPTAPMSYSKPASIPAPISPVPEKQTQPGGNQKALLDWARAHPDDPRTPAILAKYGAM